MARRSIQASEQGIQALKKAVRKKKGGQTYLAGATGCSRQTIWSLLHGNPTDCDVFMAVCQELKLNWQDIAKSESPESELDNNEDLDKLVQKIRSHCSKQIQESYGKIRLPNIQLIEVDCLYVDVYLLAQLTESTYTNLPDLREPSDQDGNRLAPRKKKKRPGFNVAEQYEKLMIFGKIGSGKSTFLRHLAIACCKGDFQPDRIPVLIEFRNDKDFGKFDLIKQIQEKLRLPDESQTQQILEEGKILLLLDGLDEVTEPFRQTVQDEVQGFSVNYYQNRVILTCRTPVIGVVGQHLEGFEYVEVADFERKQVEQFARNWFTTLAETPEQGVTLTEDFIRNLQHPENKQITELATTPILLSLICWFFQDQGFPHDRTDWYRRWVELLLTQWDEDRGIQRESSSPVYGQLSVEGKQNLLGDIAIRMFKQDQFILFEQSEIQQYIADHLKILDGESRYVLKSIEAQHGLLVQQASQIYSFPHLTFQEYFAARWLRNPSNFISTANVINGQRWQGVLSMIFTTSSANRFAQNIKAGIDHFLAEDSKLQQFLTWLKTKRQPMQNSYRPVALRAFHISIVYILALNLAHDLDLDLALSFARDLAHAHEHDLIHNLALALAHAHEHDLTHNLALALSFTRNPDFTHDITCALSLARNLALARAIASTLTLTFDRDLPYKLQELRHQLPDCSLENRENFEQWWRTEGKPWTATLQQVLIEYRSVGQDWSFSDSQVQLLKQYYDANKLLVNCLKQERNSVSLEIRQKIEDTLLLPVADLENLNLNKEV